jgi:CRISPR-associated protein Csb3
MSQTPMLRISLDPTNPGQFLACCGLLELADRAWKGAEGWFDSPQVFCLRPNSEEAVATVPPLLPLLASCRLTNTMTEQQVERLEALSELTTRQRQAQAGLEEEKKGLEKLRREAPLLLHAPFHLRLDWFLDDRAGGTAFKTWAGQQSVLDIAHGMHQALGNGSWQDLPASRWFSVSGAENGLPFHFDSDLGSQASALDVGFSCDPLGMRTRTRPLLELGAFVGLQRFRPRREPGENQYHYAYWCKPLPPSLAAVAACGLLGVPGCLEYRFSLLYRTKYLKSFLPAQPAGGK